MPRDWYIVEDGDGDRWDILRRIAYFWQEVAIAALLKKLRAK